MIKSIYPASVTWVEAEIYDNPNRPQKSHVRQQTRQPSKKWQSRSVPEVVCHEIYAGYQSSAVQNRPRDKNPWNLVPWPLSWYRSSSVSATWRSSAVWILWCFACETAYKVCDPALLSLGRTVTVLWLPWGLDAPSPLQCYETNWAYIWSEMLQRDRDKACV